ncbi:MAG: Gfo/Idh/MocA family oxidoreductase [Bryobacteraceae bacterium]|nr:Gfo/Idh/MocA family oxidoreductase [Bryobacteraceae bacterium]
MNRAHDSVSRREAFRAAGAAAAFSLVPPQAVRGSQANSQVSIGLIGSGNRGSYDGSIVHADPRARITALCDLFDSQLEKAKQTIKAPDAKVYKEFEKLLASDVDAVIIATPVFEHPRMLEAAVRAGKHVFCEKPAGLDAEGCLRVIRAGQMAGSTINISFGFQQRYGPVYLEGYKRLQEGQIGDLAVARAFWIGGGSTTPSPPAKTWEEKLRGWYGYPDLCGDIIVEQDCHNFDVLHWFLGALPVRAAGYGGTKVRVWRQTLDHLSLTFEWPGGLHVNYEANQISPRGFSRVGEEFSGTKGVIAVSRREMRHIKGPDDVETIESKRDITVDALENFIERVQTRNYENVAERSALSTMIAILGRTAIYSGREVTWKGLYGVHA